MNEDIKKDNAEWARLIFQNHIDCIEAVKNRQWAATNYVMLLYAAIIGYAKLYKEDTINTLCNGTIETAFVLYLTVIVFGISTFGIYHLVDMHLVLTKYRKKLFNIANQYKYVRKIDMIADNYATFCKYFIIITVSFIILVFVGFILVVAFLFNLVGNNLYGFSLYYYLTVFFIGDLLLILLFICDALKKSKDFDKDLNKSSHELTNKYELPFA